MTMAVCLRVARIETVEVKWLFNGHLCLRPEVVVSMQTTRSGLAYQPRAMLHVEARFSQLTTQDHSEVDFR